jgi:hypothetical protein
MTVTFDESDEDYYYLIAIKSSNKQHKISVEIESSTLMQSNQFDSNKSASSISILNEDNCLKYGIQVEDNFEHDYDYNKINFSTQMSCTYGGWPSNKWDMLEQFRLIKNNLATIWMALNSFKFIEMIFLFKNKFTLNQYLYTLCKWLGLKISN